MTCRAAFAFLRRSVSLCALLARTTPAARAPPPGTDLGSAIAADLLVRAAKDPDLSAAWRVLRSSSFKQEWLMVKGTSGETPMQAAVRECNGQLAGLLATHPDFDFKAAGLKKTRDRRDLVDYAGERSSCPRQDMVWTLSVIRAVQLSLPQQAEVEEDPSLAKNKEVWFLPKPGEWMPEESFEDLGLVEYDAPKLPTAMLESVIESPRYKAVLATAANGKTVISGSALDMPIFQRMWSLLVCHLNAAPRSNVRWSVERQLRSIGWSLFFRGSAQAMRLHYMMTDFLAMQINRKSWPPAREGEEDDFDERALVRYRFLVMPLDKAWFHIGTWTGLTAAAAQIMNRAGFDANHSIVAHGGADPAA